MPQPMTGPLPGHRTTDSACERRYTSHGSPGVRTMEHGHGSPVQSEVSRDGLPATVTVAWISPRQPVILRQPRPPQGLRSHRSGEISAVLTNPYSMTKLPEVGLLGQAHPRGYRGCYAPGETIGIGRSARRTGGAGRLGVLCGGGRRGWWPAGGELSVCVGGVPEVLAVDDRLFGRRVRLARAVPGLRRAGCRDRGQASWEGRTSLPRLGTSSTTTGC
jgi:hypothetical protein